MCSHYCASGRDSVAGAPMVFICLFAFSLTYLAFVELDLCMCVCVCACDTSKTSCDTSLSPSPCGGIEPTSHPECPLKNEGRDQHQRQGPNTERVSQLFSLPYSRADDHERPVRSSMWPITSRQIYKKGLGSICCVSREKK